MSWWCAGWSPHSLVRSNQVTPTHSRSPNQQQQQTNPRPGGRTRTPQWGPLQDAPRWSASGRFTPAPMTRMSTCVERARAHIYTFASNRCVQARWKCPRRPSTRRTSFGRSTGIATLAMRMTLGGPGADSTTARIVATAAMIDLFRLNPRFRPGLACDADDVCGGPASSRSAVCGTAAPSASARRGALTSQRAPLRRGGSARLGQERARGGWQRRRWKQQHVCRSSSVSARARGRRRRWHLGGPRRGDPCGLWHATGIGGGDARKPEQEASHRDVGEKNAIGVQKNNRELYDFQTAVVAAGGSRYSCVC